MRRSDFHLKATDHADTPSASPVALGIVLVPLRNDEQLHQHVIFYATATVWYKWRFPTTCPLSFLTVSLCVKKRHTTLMTIGQPINSN